MPPPRPSPEATDDWFLRVAEQARDALVEQGQRITRIEDRLENAGELEQERRGETQANAKEIIQLQIAMARLMGKIAVASAVGAILGGAAVTVIARLLFP